MYSWWWVELSPETCRVKPLRRINAIVASCWIYFTILGQLATRSLHTACKPEVYLALAEFCSLFPYLAVWLSEPQTALRNVRYVVNERCLHENRQKQGKRSVEVLTRVRIEVGLVECDAAPPSAGRGTNYEPPVRSVCQTVRCHVAEVRSLSGNKCCA